MKYYSSYIEELENGLFRCTITYTTIIYTTWSNHESFKTINECKEWLLEQRCPGLEIKSIGEKKEGIEIKIPQAPKLSKLYKDIV
jgi:hypothetical protein